MTELNGTTAVVTGASRGFGKAITLALVAAGAEVVGVARTPGPLKELHEQIGEAFVPVVADSAQESVAADLLTTYRPAVVVLNAGAVPPMGPFDSLSWAEFSENWSVDTRQAYEWTKAVVQLPLAPGSVVVLMSSGAALRGSPVSGGYAGAKATVRFLSTYAAAESERRNLGLRFATVLPQLTPTTDFGAAAVAAYAARSGPPERAAVLTPDQVGRHVLEVIRAQTSYVEHVLSADGAQVIA